MSETLCLCLSVSPHHHKSAIEQKPLILFHVRVNQGPERSLSQASLGGLLMSLFSPFPVPKTPMTILDDDVPRECQFVRVLQTAIALGDLFESVVYLPRDRKWLLHTWWPASSVVTSNPPPCLHPAKGFWRPKSGAPGFSSGPSLALLTFAPSSPHVPFPRHPVLSCCGSFSFPLVSLLWRTAVEPLGRVGCDSCGARGALCDPAVAFPGSPLWASILSPKG